MPPQSDSLLTLSEPLSLLNALPNSSLTYDTVTSSFIFKGAVENHASHCVIWHFSLGSTWHKLVASLWVLSAANPIWGTAFPCNAMHAMHTHFLRTWVPYSASHPEASIHCPPMLRSYSNDIRSKGLQPQLIHCAPFPSIAQYFRKLYISYLKIWMVIVAYLKVWMTIVWYPKVRISIIFLSEGMSRYQMEVYRLVQTSLGLETNRV
jgi:hypothetical protein